jgi:hypothetical protein
MMVPYHCSEIPSVLFNKNIIRDDNTTSTDVYTIFTVQVLHEGVMWRGMYPLFHITSCTSKERLNQQQSTNSISCNSIQSSLTRQRRHKFYHYWLRHSQTKESFSSLASSSVLLVILPPYCITSFTPDSYAFTSRLITWENILVRLQSLHAFTSTLGGGYFLCRQLHVATQLARHQRRIALVLNDEHAAGICTVVSGE